MFQMWRLVFFKKSENRMVGKDRSLIPFLFLPSENCKLWYVVLPQILFAKSKTTKFIFMKTIILFLGLLLALQSQAQFFKRDAPFAHTFSIVARDSVTGEMAVGVQSHWFSVGTAVSWGQNGVGVVGTQSMVEKKYGYEGLQLMAGGKPAPDVLAQLLQQDPGREYRQVAMIDATGKVSAYTGKTCIDHASQIIGPNFSVQSNMMLTDKVPAAMASAFRASYGKPLAERIMAALVAAQKAGGDIRGKQSAALLVVSGDKNMAPWNGRLVDLRVEDNPEPLHELQRLLSLHQAYDHMNNGDLATEKGDMQKAMEEYGAAMKMFPQNLEMQYWTAIMLANQKQISKASKMLQKIYAKDPNWRELTRRLPKAGLLNVEEKDLKELTK